VTERKTNVGEGLSNLFYFTLDSPALQERDFQNMKSLSFETFLCGFWLGGCLLKMLGL
jgi:hypothetical protein